MNDDERFNVKQLLVILNIHPTIKFNLEIHNIKLYEDEFYFYQNNDEIFVDFDGIRYFIEILLPSEISNEDILKIENLCKEKFKKYFKQKINKFNQFINEIERN